MEFHHVSVLLHETIEGLAIKEDGVYADGTMGGGGHSREIVSKLKNGRLIGFDRDGDAIAVCRERLAAFSDKISFVNRNFNDVCDVLKELEIEGLDGAVLDLGVSSYQLDCEERGFSYQADAPLDMRMDQTAPFSAYHVINEYSEEALAD
ncbi:MAG: 16S rRNA (cytosine(1402)-N(4))-methyltransferase RsmH, partial [Clostridia bacterium]|nr:16S rRNA (cytosine(1402)-N(4))-methyltransferase RsmH [Clostridia bacterium]